MLQPAEFQAAVSLEDEVTGELIANLDASLGSAAEWCRRGDAAAADIELADAAVTASILEQRLSELER